LDEQHGPPAALLRQTVPGHVEADEEEASRDVSNSSTRSIVVLPPFHKQHKEAVSVTQMREL